MKIYILKQVDSRMMRWVITNWSKPQILLWEVPDQTYPALKALTTASLHSLAANLTFDKGIYFNASVRREGSSKLGVNNQWGVFPSFGLGVDLANYVEIPNVNSLKLRAGFGVTGSLPNEAGLAQDLYTFNRNNYTVTFARNANPDLKWEQKEETNIGVDFGVGSKLTGSVDFFVRNIKDFILTRDVDVSVYVSGRRTENGCLRTKGIELALNYNSLNFGDVKWRQVWY